VQHRGLVVPMNDISQSFSKFAALIRSSRF
jgi:hypothetical protein